MKAARRPPATRSNSIRPGDTAPWIPRCDSPAPDKGSLGTANEMNASFSRDFGVWSWWWGLGMR